MIRQIGTNGMSFRDGSGQEILTVEEKIAEKECTVTLTGAVNDGLAYDVSDELFALASVGLQLRLEIGGLEYISDTFAEKLVHLQAHAEKTGRGSVAIRNMGAAVCETLKRNHCLASLDYELKEN